MGNIQIFLATKIKNLGFWHALGNFFLTPVRFFSGKTIIIEADQDSGLPKKEGAIAKVTSFFHLTPGDDHEYEKISKQSPNLKSTRWHDNDLFPLESFFSFVFVIPGIILGSIFKGLSYCFDPVVREAHKTVKKKLTPCVVTFGSETKPILSNQALEARLKQQLQSGQKVGALIIYAQEKLLNKECLELIKNINPSKVILVGDWKKEDFDLKEILSSKRNTSKWRKWDTSVFTKQQPDPYDYSTRVTPVLSSVNAALKRSPLLKHTIYIVKNDQGKQDGGQQPEFKKFLTN